MSRYTLYNKNISRLVAVLLVLLLLIGAFPTVFAAESGSCGSALSWSFADGTLTITGSGDMTDFPEDTMAPWYHLREEILKVSLPEGMTSVGSLAFYECKKLTAVVIPSSVTRIGNYAFANCTGIQLLNLGSGVEVIGEGAFADCYEIASLTLPGSLKSIGLKAFYRCEAITTLTVPSSVAAIGMEAFGYCKSLVSANVQAQITEIPEFLFYACQNLTSIKLPDSAENISEFAFRGCDQLSTVYYDGETKTPEQIQQIIAAGVPNFDGSGNVTSGDVGDIVISGNATENPDGTITQENTAVNRGENSTVSTTVTNTHPADSLTGQITTDIIVTVEGEDGWKEATHAVTDALKDVNDTVTSTGSTNTPPHITIYVKDSNEIDQEFVDNLTGRDVTVTVITQDGSQWQFNGTDLDSETDSEGYDLRYEVTPGDPELCQELGTDRCFVVKFLASAQVNAEVLIRLDPALSLQNATLFQRDKELKRIQSSVVDHDGFAHFYLASVNDRTDYYVAMNLPDAQQVAIIPEELHEDYGTPEFVEPIKYEVTGRTSSWGMDIKQVTFILAGGMLGAVIIIGVVMFVLNKRKLKKGYIPDIGDDEDEEQ